MKQLYLNKKQTATLISIVAILHLARCLMYISNLPTCDKHIEENLNYSIDTPFCGINTYLVISIFILLYFILINIKQYRFTAFFIIIIILSPILYYLSIEINYLIVDQIIVGLIFALLQALLDIMPNNKIALGDSIAVYVCFAPFSLAFMYLLTYKRTLHTDDSRKWYLRNARVIIIITLVTMIYIMPIEILIYGNRVKWDCLYTRAYFFDSPKRDYMAMHGLWLVVNIFILNRAIKLLQEKIKYFAVSES